VAKNLGQFVQSPPFIMYQLANVCRRSLSDTIFSSREQKISEAAGSNSTEEQNALMGEK
jgi:hypothetical protein